MEYVVTALCRRFGRCICVASHTSDRVEEQSLHGRCERGLLRTMLETARPCGLRQRHTNTVECVCGHQPGKE